MQRILVVLGVLGGGTAAAFALAAAIFLAAPGGRTIPAGIGVNVGIGPGGAEIINPIPAPAIDLPVKRLPAPEPGFVDGTAPGDDLPAVEVRP